MIMHRLLMVFIWLGLAACTPQDGFTPREKMATIDPATGALQLPWPCPDWSHNPAQNAGNTRHSNYGCAVNNNLAVQLDDPHDLIRGHGSAGPDGAITAGVVGHYRAGDIPAPLQPLQGQTGSNSQ